MMMTPVTNHCDDGGGRAGTGDDDNINRMRMLLIPTGRLMSANGRWTKVDFRCGVQCMNLPTTYCRRCVENGMHALAAKRVTV